jgi:glycosyltransferase involved in cell wall biosynthesis
MTTANPRLIRIFTPSYADADNTNAQNLTVKEIVARLPEEEFHVTMLCAGDPDPRLKARGRTRFFQWTPHGNTLRLIPHCLFPTPDIYFFPRAGPLDRIFLALRKHLSLKTALVTYVVMEANENKAKGMIARSIREGNVVLGNSKRVSAMVGEAFGIRAGVIYDGVDRRYYFPPQNKPERDTRTVLYAGSFQPRKRVELLIHAAARFSHVKFHLAGAGETEETCRFLAQKLECSNVNFLGKLSSASLGEEMRNADIFFFPSILEGNPQVLLQASACGLPCVAMDIYRSDYVVDGKTGFLARSDAELMTGLDCLLSNVTLRRSFGAAGASHVLQFDWEDIARQWVGVFRNTARRNQV